MSALIKNLKSKIQDQGLLPNLGHDVFGSALQEKPDM